MFSRRKVILSSASAMVAPASIRSNQLARNPLLDVSRLPNTAVVSTENGSVSLKRNQSKWQGQGIEVGTTQGPDGFAVTLQSPRDAAMRIHLRWQLEVPVNLQFLGDDWERSYGNLAWRGMEPERVMPWYFLSFDGVSTVATGVETAASALCFWQVDPAGVSLWLDLRNGGRGLELGNRELRVASIVTKFYPETKPFAAAKHFCHRLSATPRLPVKPVY